MSKAVMVILNYNDADTVITLVDSVKSYDCLEAVVIVDNCSPDGSYDRLRQRFGLDASRVHVIQAPDNKGYATGNNFGVQYAEEQFDPDWIFIANPDIAVTEETLQEMVRIMESNPGYGVLAPIVEEGYNVWNLPGFMGMIESLFLIWFNLHKRAIKKALLRKQEEVTTVGVVEGSFFLIRRRSYDEIEGLDERTFLYAEEIILARRLQEIGQSIGICPGLRYHHYHSVSIKKAYQASKRRAFPNFYKSFRIYNRYYLHTNKVQDVIFRTMYGLAYAERFLYDCVKR